MLFFFGINLKLAILKCIPYNKSMKTSQEKQKQKQKQKKKKTSEQSFIKHLGMPNIFI